MLIENKCPLCGKVNPNTEWYCEACGAKLPLQGNRAATQAEPGLKSPRAQTAPTGTANAAVPAKPAAKNNSVGWIVGSLLFIFVFLPWGCRTLFSAATPEPTPTPYPTEISLPAATPVPAFQGNGANADGMRGGGFKTGGGATCVDGSHSSASGSGACSHHGGVAHWN